MNAPKVTSILFVCMGNICRSPTAEGVFLAKAKAAGLLDQLIVDSAGTHLHHVGEAPDPRAQTYALKRGIDLSMQRARQVRADDFVKFDLILAMDRNNLALLEAACPLPYRQKLGLLMRYAQHNNNTEVPDPYYDGGRSFDLVLDYIEDATEGLLHDLQVESRS
ncbi:low molecular weight phosphotyrosine protein phosphatase [Undibacterium jejuense]|uniref:protein-tyrosine-phosphatase n=1 Tax=Undibacterium jejuense TaxID=1344949 RepID=A0A923KP57_9BURK|nr:low molecular weight protein-tyrosine-phosphatase [Undibacterium jejuense]MBC3862528.1 low molecular weight phosphotyrosine protein phosphatase [Undibacterium jejuense]